MWWCVTIAGLSAIILTKSELIHLTFTGINHIHKEDLVSLFRTKNKLTQIYLWAHNTLDTESVISILESTFKYRPDESQDGLIEEKIQKNRINCCANVNHNTIKKYLNDNKDCYVVKFLWIEWEERGRRNLRSKRRKFECCLIEF